MISFSGIDCGGKSTQIELIKQRLSVSNIKCKVIHSRGGYTPALEFLKGLVRSKKTSIREQGDYRAQVHGNPKKRRLLLWLSIFDLALYYGIYFRIVELFGNVILADRYFEDTRIDFRMKYPNDPFENWIIWKVAEKISLEPQCSLIYTIPAELSMYRSTLKEEPWPEPIEVRRERIDRYITEINNHRWMCVIDATFSIEAVFEESINAICSYCPKIQSLIRS